jgi:hypothetical protein
MSIDAMYYFGIGFVEEFAPEAKPLSCAEVKADFVNYFTCANPRLSLEPFKVYIQYNGIIG